MDIIDPTLGPWYFGFYGFSASNFTFKLTMDAMCPDFCSRHGSCAGSYCQCYTEYRGTACETRRDPLPDNVIVLGFVSQSSWNYYRYSSNTANNFIIEVNHTNSADCDIYVNTDRNPTVSEYVYRDITSGSNTKLRIDNPGSKVWFIGIYGYTQCDYRLRVFSSTQCPGGCGHGTCSQNGRCICNPGYTGPTCNVTSNVLRNGVPISNQNITEGEWRYFEFTLNTTSQLNIVLHERDTEGFVWLFVSAGGYPSLLSYDEADTSINSDIHRIKIEFESPRVGTRFYIGVYGSPFNLRSTLYDVVAWTPPF
jgi:hypothetical protein